MWSFTVYKQVVTQESICKPVTALYALEEDAGHLINADQMLTLVHRTYFIP